MSVKIDSTNSFFVKPSERKEVPITDESPISSEEASINRTESFAVNKQTNEQIKETSRIFTKDALKNLSKDLQEKINSDMTSTNSNSSNNHFSSSRSLENLRDKQFTSRKSYSSENDYKSDSDCSDSSDEVITGKNKNKNKNSGITHVHIETGNGSKSGSKKRPRADDLSREFYTDIQQLYNELAILKAELAKSEGEKRNLALQISQFEDKNRFMGLSANNTDVENRELKGEIIKIKKDFSNLNNKNKNLKNIDSIFEQINNLQEKFKDIDSKKINFSSHISAISKKISDLENFKSSVIDFVQKNKINSIFIENPELNNVSINFKKQITEIHNNIDNSILQSKNTQIKQKQIEIPFFVFFTILITVFSFFTFKKFEYMTQ